MVELELDSSADVDRGAVLCAPLNPMQLPDRPGFGFRARDRGGARRLSHSALPRVEPEARQGYFRGRRRAGGAGGGASPLPSGSSWPNPTDTSAPSIR